MPTVSFTTSGALRKSALRQANERLVLDSIRRAPGISRTEIARITGFSRTSVAFVVNRLLRQKLVTEEKAESGNHAGRPAAALQITGRSLLAIGVEMASPVTGVVLMDSSGNYIARRSVTWRPDSLMFLDSVKHAIREVTAGYERRQILGVGISLPGTIEKATGCVLGAEALGWFNVEVGEVLRQDLQWPLFFENDANLSALAEQWYLPADGELLRYFVYVRAQGGLGTGVVADGRILHGAASAGLEFGHVMLYPDGRPCRCGNRGCWEQYASDAALVRAYTELGGVRKTDAVQESSALVVQRAHAGEIAAVKSLQTTAKYLALGFVNLAAALNPQAIIVGEPFSSAWDLIGNLVIEEVQRRVPAYCFNGLRILPSKIGVDAAVRGAAALVLAHYFTRFDHTREDSLPNGVSMVAHG